MEQSVMLIIEWLLLPSLCQRNLNTWRRMNISDVRLSHFLACCWCVSGMNFKFQWQSLKVKCLSKVKHGMNWLEMIIELLLPSLCQRNLDTWRRINILDVQLSLFLARCWCIIGMNIKFQWQSLKVKCLSKVKHAWWICIQWWPTKT